VDTIDFSQLFDDPVEYLLARTAIEDALKRYCRAVDRSDWELLRSVYHSDAAIDHGAYHGSVDGFVDWVAARRVNMLHTAHFVANTQVAFESRTAALAETYGFASQRFAPPHPVVAAGNAEARVDAVYRYVDRFTCVDGQWRISQALLVSGDRWTTQLREPVTFPDRKVVQEPSMADVVYRLLRGSV
jgi:hypothetical protein